VNRTAVLNVVGLTRGLIGTHTPRIAKFLGASNSAVIDPAFPAVTCTAQSDYLTGRRPSAHGIVANGWYDRTLSEVQFWKQSNHVVTASKIWDELKARDPKFSCAKMFWWYNMYSGADWSVTPRPMYPADGRKFFDIYTWPYDLRPALKRELGDFPFPTFWGPAAGVKTPQGEPDAVSRWIAESAKWIERKHSPTLNLVYLPHLDYNLQRLGPDHPSVPEDLRRIDAIVGDLIDFFASRGVQVVILSEYGITPVSKPVHLNRVFRERGWLTIKEEMGRELPDVGNSKAFAVADHQVAHIIVNDRALLNEVRQAVATTPGVASVLGADEKRELGIDHVRAGDLIATSLENAWFTYYHWLEDSRAPDFARCVDIHRKPGYDPVELFLDPKIPAVKLKIMWRLLQKKLGFRMLMDVIPLDATLVKGSHGVRPASRDDWPLIIAPGRLPSETLVSTDVYGVLRDAVAGA
jgi:predicted AlkP superfamily pyrophosphatase or phosphodiesterase